MNCASIGWFTLRKFAPAAMVLSSKSISAKLIAGLFIVLTVKNCIEVSVEVIESSKKTFADYKYKNE